MEHQEPFLNDILRNTNNQDWLIVSLMVLATAYIFVRIIYGKYWKRYRQAILYGQEAQKLTHEKNVLLLQAAISLNILAMFSMGLFIHTVFIHFTLIDFLPGNLYGWLLTSLAVILVIGIKYLLNYLLGKSGDNITASTQINHQWLINLKNFGFFLLPFTAASAFTVSPLTEVVLYIGIAVLLFMLIMNYVKGFLVLLQHQISIYYGILYLCTLEILPILIIWKVIRLLMD